MINSNTFELRAKSYFITFSDCEILHETCLAHLKSKFNDLGQELYKYVIARELHEDGLRHHLHCYVELKKQIRKRVDAKFADLGGHHPNIQGVRSPRRVIRYVVKDQNFITNDPKMVEEAVEKWGINKKDIGKQLVDGGNLEDIVEANPQLIFGYSRLKTDVDAYRAAKQEIKDLGKPCGVWIGGASGIGKSYFSRNLVGAELGWRTFVKNPNPKYWMGYGGHEIVVADEVDATWADSCEGFKTIADEYHFFGETKGGHTKLRPRIFIVTSNLTLDEFLSAAKIKDDYATRLPWTRRFLEYWITDRSEFEDLLKDIIKNFKD